ncbi:hypothetical protein [Terrimonas pollutisoli]|uniref:hypothetical protein n=1 Tax=Terrimonas pollutisoli TaxID=3034147 RepID=UPI0023EDDBAD|nr:hypothetical protein [Terrimonas sp. H1YJ31]
MLKNYEKTVLIFIYSFVVSLVFSLVKHESSSLPFAFIRKDKWKGFERIHFTVADHNAYYVQPKQTLEGKPWVWRASFPDWHTEMDSLLLAKGFHVFFCKYG